MQSKMCNLLFLCCLVLWAFGAFALEEQLIQLQNTSQLACKVGATASVLVDASGQTLDFEAEKAKTQAQQKKNSSKIKKLKNQIKALKKSGSSAATKKALKKKNAQLKALNKLSKNLSTLLSAIIACQNGTLDAVPCAPNGDTCDDGNECTLGDLCENSKCKGTPFNQVTSVGCGLGACTRSIAKCTNGIPGVCVPGTPSSEVCNGIDDDCDGAIDNGLNCGAPGSCQGGLVSCNNTCVNTSSDSANCGSCGNNCGAGNTCVSGVCKKANGQACSNFSQCQSNVCADGVCCATTCPGFCKSCALAGSLGICTLIPSGSDPDNECTDLGSSNCSFDGMCNGNGACRLYSAGIVCHTAECSSGTLINADTCNGAGSCVDNGTTPCGNYLCDSSTLTCPLSCGDDDDCLSSKYCSNGVCVNRLCPGSPCERDRMCSVSCSCNTPGCGGICSGPGSC